MTAFGTAGGIQGGGPAIADALAGQTDVIFVNPVAVLAQIRAGKSLH